MISNLAFSWRRNVHFAFVVAMVFLATVVFIPGSLTVLAQGGLAEAKEKAAQLLAAHKYLEALPLLETITAAEPENAQAFYDLGTALLARSIAVSDPAEQKMLRVRARAAFVKSQSLGNDTMLVRAFIDAIPTDGSKGADYSSNPRSDALTAAGERAFASRDLDRAIELYKLALEADPKNYFAALFIGDCYLGKEDFPNAEIWYKKAIGIDPNIETAYRYSATPLMKQGKYAEALDRYIEAWITEPYNKFALNGLLQWGKVTNTQLGHPKIEPPKTDIGADGKSNTTINVNPLADDGSMAWIAYVATREAWKKEKFSKQYPGEKEYRHTLAEEADALRAVVEMARTLKTKDLNPQIAMIERLDSEGLLEAFILLALADRGIAKDYPGYLKQNRARLREYVKKYVVAAK